MPYLIILLLTYIVGNTIKPQQINLTFLIIRCLYNIKKNATKICTENQNVKTAVLIIILRYIRIIQFI